MKIFLYLLFILLPAFAWAQKVEMRVAGQWCEIPAQQTQSELKPGWKIVDYQMKSKLMHYLSGSRAQQAADDAQPDFRITPAQDETLVDYAIIRLKCLSDSRKLPKAVLIENAYQRFEPDAFELRAQDDSFVCHPRRPMPSGEYIVVCLTQKPIGELMDLKVYPFCVIWELKD